MQSGFPAVPAPPRTSPASIVAAVLVGLWAVAATVAGQAVGWLAEQVLLVAELDRAVWLPALPGVLGAALVGGPATALALVPRSPAVRAAGRAWLAGAVALAVGGLLRTIPMPQNELYLAALAAAATGAALALRLARRSAGAPGSTGGPQPVLFAVAGGLASLLPWLVLGALGGLSESVLAALAAAAVGWLAAAILDRSFWAGYDRTADGAPTGPARRVLLAGLVAGVALLLLAAGTGQDGAQLAEMLVLPPLGVAAAALRIVTLRGASAGASPPAGPVGVLVGLAALGPLAFADPEEISLLLAESRDVPYWVAVTAGVSLAVAVLLAAGYGVGLARRRSPLPRRWVAAGTATVLLGVAVGGYVGAGQPGLHGERLFVVLKEQADLSGIDTTRTGPAGRVARGQEIYRRLTATADRSQAALRRELDRLHLRYTPYYLVNAVEVEGGPVVRAWLSRRSDVSRVLLGQRLRPLPAPPEPRRGTDPAPSSVPWNISLIGADRARTELRADGSGIVVGSSDSGVDGGHPALSGGYRGGDDSWYDPWNGTRTPTDEGGHGTHTLATAVGQLVGVAPGAKWIGCVNLDRNLGNPARYLDCLQFMLAPFPPGGNPLTDGRPDRAPQVLTNSWGCPPIEGCDADALRPATAALAAAGIFVVAAAGNSGPRCGSVADPPAPYPDVLTVGAVDRQRRVTTFSGRGPTPDGAVKPDVVAPGAGILSALPGGGYGTLDGTSMATPHVAGVVALMWSANPALIGDLDRTRRILRETATPVAPPSDGTCGSPADSTGAGLIDARAAVQAAMT